MVSENGSKVSIQYTTNLPEPDSTTINGEYDVLDYEIPIKTALQRIITAQLLQ
jgi:hypothetical protein